MGKKNPNMRTRAWGPPAWFVLIMVAMGYPSTSATKKQQREYRKFYESFGDVMPCNLCRDSYKKFLKELPLTSNVLSTRRNLVYWVFKIKNKVNKKLGCKQLTFKQFQKKYTYYESFRATTCSKNTLGCDKASENIKKPKKIKLVTLPDKRAKIKKKKK